MKLKQFAFPGERANGGQYTIKAKNKWGDVETSGILTVVLCPEVSGPDDVSVSPGKPAQLKAYIQANPPPTIIWLDRFAYLHCNTNVCEFFSGTRMVR